MSEIRNHFPMFARLRPRTEWRGGRITDIDNLTLEEAARMASKHAGEEVTPADFLRAAGRGEILLRAIVHRAAKVRRHDGGVLFNKGAANENIVPAGSIPTLPLTACKHLADAGRASWRTFDGFEEIDGQWMRYTKGMLTDDEPDFETVPADCRVTGCDVHALADEYTVPEATQAQPQAAAPAPVVAESASSVPSNGLATAQIAVIFDGLPYTAENWPKRASDTHRLRPARVALGAAGGATSLWCPVKLAQLIHGKARGAEKQKTLEALNKRFKSNPVLEPWRDAWNEHYEMFNDAD